LSGSALAEPFATRVRHYRPSPARWPTGLNLKLAVIADLHACEPWMGRERIRRIVAHANALAPDCVLLLGDYVAGDGMMRYADPIAEKDWAHELGRLKAPLGVHAVLGNHDWWADADVQRRRRGTPAAGLALLDAGIPIYENASVRLEKGGVAFWLAGLADQEAFWTRPMPTGRDDLAGTLRQIPDEAPVVLMAHEPDIFPHVPDRVSVTVAGHTHGGQVRILGYAPIVPSRYGNRYVYGHIVEQSRNLIVSAGLGCSGVPVRFGAPPEIVMLELMA
jgi:predicted MPP superfamily phosphohydrolase